MYRKLLVALTLAATPLVAQTAPAPARPNFSGTWTMDAAKSFGEGSMPLPSTATYLVTHVGDSIHVDQKTDDGLSAVKVWKVDGRAWSNALNYQGVDMILKQVLSWDGAVLKIHTNTEYQGTPVEQAQTWTLSADGKTLTDKVTTMVNGEVFATLTMVLNKK